MAFQSDAMRTPMGMIIRQVELLKLTLKQLLNLNAEKIGAGTIVHAANSAATIRLQESHFSLFQASVFLHATV